MPSGSKESCRVYGNPWKLPILSYDSPLMEKSKSFWNAIFKYINIKIIPKDNNRDEHHMTMPALSSIVQHCLEIMFPLTTGYRWHVLKFANPYNQSVRNKWSYGRSAIKYYLDSNEFNIFVSVLIWQQSFLSVVCSTLWINQMRENKIQNDDRVGVLLGMV